jgi:hypothetical protein
VNIHAASARLTIAIATSDWSEAQRALEILNEITEIRTFPHLPECPFGCVDGKIKAKYNHELGGWQAFCTQCGLTGPIETSDHWDALVDFMALQVCTHLPEKPAHLVEETPIPNDR